MRWLWTAVALYKAETTFEVTKLSPGKQERHSPLDTNPDGTSSGALVLNGSLLGDPIPGVEEVLLSKSLKPWASNRVEMELEWNRPSHSPSWPGKDEADDAHDHCWRKNCDYASLLCLPLEHTLCRWATVSVQTVNKESRLLASYED